MYRCNIYQFFKAVWNVYCSKLKLLQSFYYLELSILFMEGFIDTYK